MFVPRESVFSVALQCNKTVEGHIDPVVSDILKDTYVSFLLFCISFGFVSLLT